MAERVKVYEEKKGGLPIWAWLLPLLLLLALLAYFLLNHKPATDAAAAPAAVPTAAAAAVPTLGTLHFATDQATLTPEDQQVLQQAAIAMKGNPGLHLRLEGFTDSTGTDPHNDSLSDRRAHAAADYLQSQGVDRARLTGGGFGAANPVDTNATTQARPTTVVSNSFRNNNLQPAAQETP